MLGRPFDLPPWRLLVFILWAFLVVAGSAPSTCRADSPLSVVAIAEVRVGFDGVAKAGHWTAVSLRVQGGPTPWSGQLRLTTIDSDGIPVEFLDGRTRSLQANQQQWWTGYVKLGRPRSRIHVHLVDDRGDVSASTTATLSESRAARPATETLYVTLGLSIGLEEAVERQRREQRERTTMVVLSDAAALPDRWEGYSAVTTLAMATSQTDFIDAMSDDQLQAIRQWVRMGGRLVICSGRTGGAMFSAEGRLRDLAPGLVSRVETLEDASNLELFVSARQRLAPFPMAMLDAPSGVSLLDVRDRLGQRRSFLIRAPLGFGDVVFVAGDLDQAPLAGWSGRSGLVDSLLRIRPGKLGSQANTSNRLQFGYADMSSQLRGALDLFQGADGQQQVTNVLFSLVVMMIVGYALLVGPIDYLILRGVVGRMQWTWLTFPLVVVGFSVLLAWMTVRLKGDEVRLNQVDVVDIDAESGLARGSTIAHLFSPQADTFDLSLRPQWPLEAESEDSLSLSWQGLPGTSLGGLDSRTPAIFDTGYVVQNHDPRRPLMQGLPIVTGGSRALIGRYSTNLGLGPASTLADNNGRLEGELVNPLNVRLTECVLIYANWAHRLENALAPGDRIAVSALPRRDLEWRLTRRRVQQEDSSSATKPWDQGDENLGRILEIMMFHEAAGGESYTQLPHQYLGFLDVTRLLHSGRAVLVGRVENIGGSVMHEEIDLTERATQRVAYCRVVLPVTTVRKQSTGDLSITP